MSYLLSECEAFSLLGVEPMIAGPSIPGLCRVTLDTDKLGGQQDGVVFQARLLHANNVAGGLESLDPIEVVTGGSPFTAGTAYIDLPRQDAFTVGDGDFALTVLSPDEATVYGYFEGPIPNADEVAFEELIA